MLLLFLTFPRVKITVLRRPEKYTIKPERKEIAAVSIDLTRHDDFQGPRKLEVCGCGGRPVSRFGPFNGVTTTAVLILSPSIPDADILRKKR